MQSFRTLCGKVTEALQKKLSEVEANNNEGCEVNDLNINQLNESINELENINAYLFSIEALMEKIFEIKVPDNIEAKFREIAGELAPDPLNIDRIILNRLFHQTPDSPDKSSNTN